MTDDVGRSSDSPVSRETSTPPVPAAARGAFPVERQALVERYVELLATAGVERGLIGPREAPRLWSRHVLNCAVLAHEIPEGVSVCDVGSGAGLPGLVLALARPDLQITLVEPLLRRTTFLSEVVDELGLSNVRVERGRADALHAKERFDVVTSRAVAALPRLLEWSMPLVAPRRCAPCAQGRVGGRRGRCSPADVAGPGVRRARRARARCRRNGDRHLCCAGSVGGPRVGIVASGSGGESGQEASHSPTRET